MAGDSNDKPHDTDPAVADTHASGGGSDASSSHSASRGPRGVRSGDTLGRYELAEELGEGGMAQVFKARDKELRRDVAVKVLFPHLARKDEIVRRFQREARAAAGLEQANILRIYDVGGAEGDDPPYIVMEMIRGRSLLAEIEQRGPMFAEVAACIGALLADALGAAHKASIVHRDMKPANVMISHDGRVLLTDFGVARLETEDSLVTKTGALLGTPAYMSPEQATGDVATAKSDLYSLGATLYQLATGTLPYAGSPAKVLAQIATGSMVSPVKKRASVGPDLSRLIERMMATEPEQRVGSAAEASAELRAIAASGGLGEPADELATYFADRDAYVKQRTPKIVANVIAAAKRALAEAKLPRAIALADRASSLAPTDPAVITLLDKVADSGRTMWRNRVLAIVAIGLVIAGGGAVLAMKLLGGGETAPVLDAGVVAMVADAAPDAPPALPADAPGDAPVLVLPDAAVKPRDAGVVMKKDAALGMVAGLDAPVAPVLDAMPASPPDVAIAAKGTIVVKADSWCNVTIDEQGKGEQRVGTRFAVEVDAGRHSVVCEQNGLEHRWQKTVVVPAGGTVAAEGSVLGFIDVEVEIDATIDGRAYKAGSTARLKISRLRVKAGNVERTLSFLGPCQLRLTPELGCYPGP